MQERPAQMPMFNHQSALTSSRGCPARCVAVLFCCCCCCCCCCPWVAEKAAAVGAASWLDVPTVRPADTRDNADLAAEAAAPADNLDCVFVVR
eukprot:CAMPEP_0183343922 /NCGR_PEP_ID=MMETSP0164_2-20130417/9739_1 /TAXON_ID=221442 /ORGANISM="Coccolithus pelagicus ssp braarudi, Strain PLY182g" /LENGTH=92 /DNA_ID=CAMNT_0025514851 /DNA_START=145 /DNA_END=423 /DNA_ORIENTATION=+